MNKKGQLIVISGPSGCGKGSVINKLLKENENIILSTSMTTRNKRLNEIEGKDYLFVSKDVFMSKINKNEFVEYAEYCNNFYGTPKEFIQKNINLGKVIILEIEVNGALQVKKNFSEATFIFFMPPSLKTLKDRLINRNTESLEKISVRLKTAMEEITRSHDYDFILTIDTVDNSCYNLSSIINSLYFKYENSKKIIYEVLKNA
ncbi:MAG: guanylate kinase [Oscillospiraceae bacterium]|nr:guanylate kinase [Oscillospiraceae bacterium]